MPVSHLRHIPTVFNKIDKIFNNLGISSALDVGCGFGKYGVLFRERYEVRFKKCLKEDWQIKLDAIEVWADYITPIHRYTYNNIFIEDVKRIINTLNPYDVIYALEILEHMELDRALNTVKKLYNLSNKLLIISFPRTFKGNEGADWINPYERHRCLLTKELVEKEIGPIEQLTPTIFAVEK